jgi:hypothetical protein
LPATLEPAISSPTSRTSRPATASSQRAERSSGRRDGSGRRLKNALGAIALAPLLEELHQPVALQRPQVVVRLLSGEPDACRERARGSGLGKLGEQAATDRVERSLGGGRVVDDGDIVHGPHFLTDNFRCQV